MVKFVPVMSIADTAERVRQEMRRFEASLPRLMPLYADRWVVFRDGDVVSVHDDEEAAYRAGIAKFGRQLTLSISSTGSYVRFSKLVAVARAK